MNKRQARMFALYLAIETLEMRCSRPGLPYLIVDSQHDSEKIAKEVDNIISALSKRLRKLEGTGVVVADRLGR